MTISLNIIKALNPSQLLCKPGVKILFKFYSTVKTIENTTFYQFVEMKMVNK